MTIDFPIINNISEIPDLRNEEEKLTDLLLKKLTQTNYE